MTSAVPSDPAGAEHVPVLPAEVMAGLAIGPGARIIDATLGGGGHTAQFLADSAPTGTVLGIDADPAALRRVAQRLPDAVAQGRLILVNQPFQALADVAQAHDFVDVDAILLDLGISSFQIETADRGFSFLLDGPLDMRFDLSQELTASDIVNHWSETEIADILFQYGEERRSRRIARAIVRARPLETTSQLAAVIERAVGGRKGSRIHPATQSFQALRIAVNRELEQLEAVLPVCLELLRPGGRLAVISFHSLEDRLVKQWMQQEARDWVPDPVSRYGGTARTPRLRILNKKPITAAPAELEQNPRSRSAKLRLAEKLAVDNAAIHSAGA
ncbi:MAG: 16S rRNA (cytosine(1402)-N(4))-methyltransferase RsmH [Caldilineaceae bacterium]